MNDNHTKRCLTSLAIREMQIITRRHQYTLTMAAKIKKKKKAVIRPNAGNKVKKLDLPYIAGGNGQWCSHSRKQFGSCFLRN